MLFPARTGLGLEMFVTFRSAWVAEPTGIATVAELFCGAVSCVGVLTLTVSVMIVPPATPPLTRYMAVTVPVEPGGTLALLHATGAIFGQDQVAPPELTTATETKVVLAGVASLSAAVLQLLGPRLLMSCVYVIVLPAVTGFGVPLLVTDKSQTTVTAVLTVVLLLLASGSDVVADTEEVAVIVAAVTVDGTFNTTMISAEAAAERMEPLTQLIVPVPPTDGVVQLHPAGAETDWKVVFAGVA
jgi:hypothetical protein